MPCLHSVAFGNVEVVVLGDDPVVERGEDRFGIPVIVIGPFRRRDARGYPVRLRVGIICGTVDGI